MTSLRGRIDPELLEGLDGFLAASGPRGLAGIADPVARRAAFAAMMGAADGAPAADDGVRTEDLEIPGPEGAPSVAIRVYRPVSERPLPGLLYIHGGGFVIGSIETEDPIARMVAAQVPAIVVSVDYRLAPEHPHPAPVEDCYAALCWLADRTSTLGVYGGSAGGALAAGVALLARDRSGPKLAAQMLLYPMLDDRADSPSCHEIDDIGVFDGWATREGFEALLGDAARTDAVDAYAAPARAGDLSGLPPTYIDTGELDALRDEDVDYAMRLLRAGVPTELHVYAGAFHGWDVFAPDAAVSRRTVAERLGFLRRTLHAPGGAGR